jgi:sugar O-acyltransferase (sialic acid O-acetyltransferase NeuD family)
MRRGIIVVGAFHEIIELTEELNVNIFGLIDNEKKGDYMGYPIIATDETANDLSIDIKQLPLIITPDMPAIRMKLSRLYEKYGFYFTNLISTGSKISKSANIGNGVVIQNGVNVSAQTEIFDFVKLNTNCNIMHNSIIRKYTTIAPNAVILGNVNIGEACYIGSNSTILPNVRIADNVTIGAGAVVTKDIDTPGTFVGIPAKRIKK